MKHVLLIDDDAAIRSLLKDYLSQHAFRVTGIKDSEHLLRIMTNDPPDLVIVDLNLGHEDGLEVVRKVTTSSDAPVVIISGDRLDEADKVVGLELGAVDYITKPFGVRELLARVRSSLRRELARPKGAKDPKAYYFGNWALDVKTRQLQGADNHKVKLTAGEFNLLRAFLGSPRHVLTREHLLSSSRVHSDEVFDRSIDVLILRLRRKLNENPARPDLIKTERGAGYIFDADVSVDRPVSVPS
ncbi:response regulator [Rhizobium halophilum]|uniref:response regulator n=1 Tax=Rhizobium halophilum TaxID=2846852 RepID=UPI001EFDBB69|nr:response regulator [Rhizobium halophilum]MCF6371140.1 response regulator [Rhizobium halophilum]